MAGFIGRKIVLTWGGQEVPGVREKSIAINGEPLDVSDDGSDGYREILAEAGELTVNISLSGVTKSTVLKEAAASLDDRTEAVVIQWPVGQLTGQFFLASYNETGNYKEAVTWEGELQSTGAFVYDPAAT